MQTNDSKSRIRAQKLSQEIKWKIAEDYGISYDARSKFFDEHPESLINVLVKNMGKEDRNRAVLDLLLDIDNAEHTEKIITVNMWLMVWTAALALATFLIAGIEIWNRLYPEYEHVQKMEIRCSPSSDSFPKSVTIPPNGKDAIKAKAASQQPVRRKN